MADGPGSEAATGLTRLFIVETTAAPDALVWVLSVCASRQVALTSVAYAAAPEGGVVRIEAERLDEHDVGRLAARLQSGPLVRGVTVGWRTPAQP